MTERLRRKLLYQLEIIYCEFALYSVKNTVRLYLYFLNKTP